MRNAYKKLTDWLADWIGTSLVRKITALVAYVAVIVGMTYSANLFPNGMAAFIVMTVFIFLPLTWMATEVDIKLRKRG